MSDPNDPRDIHLKRKFEELPGLTIAERRRNKRRGGFRVHDLMLPADGGSINIAHPSSAPPTLTTPSLTIHAVDIIISVPSKIPFNLPAPK